MKIYTGRGDEGMTDLRTMERVSKTDDRIEAYGTVDEVNALVGRARPTGYGDIDTDLEQVQNHLHIVQADLANPEADEDDPAVAEHHVETIEERIDSYDAELEPLEDFILPGGAESGAELHHARAVCRRAERRIVALLETAEANTLTAVYLNRLSDLLFTLARTVNAREGVAEENPTY